MYLLAALHGIEASFLASDSLRKLRSSIHKVVWCDPAFCVVWYRFRLLRRYLALWLAEVGRVYPLLAMVSEGCPGHGPVHLLSASAVEIGFRWDPDAHAWIRPGSPLLGNLAGPFSILGLLFLMLGAIRLLLTSVGERVFAEDPC